MSRPGVLATLRRWQADPMALLGSWTLSVVLMVSLAFWQGLLAVWAISSPAPVVASIARLLPFWIGWTALLANTVACLWRRIPLLTGRGVAPVGEVGIADRPAALRRRATLATFLFHGAFLLVATGFLLGLGMREERTLRVAVGETFTGTEEQVVHIVAPARVGAPPALLSFTLDRLTPAFWKDEMLFTELAADLSIGEEKSRTRINRPLWLSWGTFLRLSGFGHAPVYELAAPDGALLEAGVVKMNVFPPGSRDSFSFSRFPHRVWLEVFPNLVSINGEATTDGLAVGRPGFLVRVFRGHLEVASGMLGAGEELDVEGLRLRFPEIRYWGDFSLVSDPGIPVLFLGMLVGLAGLALKLWTALGAVPTETPVRGEDRP